MRGIIDIPFSYNSFILVKETENKQVNKQLISNTHEYVMKKGKGKASWMA